jgi:hypothetical protein
VKDDNGTIITQKEFAEAEHFVINHGMRSQLNDKNKFVLMFNSMVLTPEFDGPLSLLKYVLSHKELIIENWRNRYET